MLSDHRVGSFGEHYGTLIKDMRIESRAIFVFDKHDTIKHVEYVKEVADFRTTKLRCLPRKALPPPRPEWSAGLLRIA
jgi:hypothetical protein